MAPLKLNLSTVPYPSVKGMLEVGNSLGDYTLKNARSSVVKHIIGSFDAKSCTIVNINNGKRNYIAHVAPELEVPQILEKRFEKTLQEMENNSSDKLRAIIIGGWDSSNPRSFGLPITIANLFERIGIDFSMICGKPKGAPSESMVALQNKVTVWSDMFKELFAKLDVKKATKEDVQQALEKHYEIVELSDDIPVKITERFGTKAQALTDNKRKFVL